MKLTLEVDFHNAAGFAAALEHAKRQVANGGQYLNTCLSGTADIKMFPTEEIKGK